MKQNIHPEYRSVIYRDKSAGYSFLTRSTLDSDEKLLWEDGKEYPVIDVEISSQSHPFYTGEKRILDNDGAVAKFNKRYGKKTQSDR